MEEQSGRKPEEQPARKMDEFVRRLVPDPNNPPDTLLLSGFLGASSEADHTRLYFDVELSNYIEIPNDAILHTQPLPAEQGQLGGSYVWIKRDAEVVYGKAGTQRPKARFFQGAIMQEYAGGATQPAAAALQANFVFSVGPTCILRTCNPTCIVNSCVWSACGYATCYVSCHDTCYVSCGPTCVTCHNTCVATCGVSCAHATCMVTCREVTCGGETCNPRICSNPIYCYMGQPVLPQPVDPAQAMAAAQAPAANMLRMQAAAAQSEICQTRNSPPCYTWRPPYGYCGSVGGVCPPLYLPEAPPYTFSARGTRCCAR